MTQQRGYGDSTNVQSAYAMPNYSNHNTAPSYNQKIRSPAYHLERMNRDFKQNAFRGRDKQQHSIASGDEQARIDKPEDVGLLNRFKRKL